MFYFIVFLIIALLAMLDISKSNLRLRTEFALLVILLLFFIAAFRYETGMDWLEYQDRFKSIPTFKSIHKISDLFGELDFGYHLLCTVLKSLGGGIQTVFFFMQLFGSVLLWKSIKKYSNQKTASVLVYFSLLFFLLDLNLMRQMLAVNIFFYSISYIYDKQMWKYFGFILLAFAFHWSAILFLPLYFILNHSYSSRFLYIIVLGFILFFLFQIRTGDLLYTITKSILGTSAITNKVNYYTTTYLFSTNRTLSIGFFLNIFIFIVTMTNRKKLESSIKYFNLLLNLMILQLFFYLVTYEYIELSGRLRFYTLISYVVIIPGFIHIYHYLFNRIIVIIFIILYCFSYSYIYMIPNKKTIAYNPYQNYLVHILFNTQSSGESRLMKYKTDFEMERIERNKEQKK